uniref:Uncharacterized protein n=1 Tax=Chrysotila carterae TaxID=13221 RepID=A0A7S4ETW1_CHRCT|mmetsp:Transcript_1445/g.2974  ORF Transcript_1445/g.2974 Transcript_1445/m.2974 type:complete len:274 (+) Transcript_1445:196-1017(+)
MERAFIEDGSENDAITPLPSDCVKLSTTPQHLSRHMKITVNSEGGIDRRLGRTNFHWNGSIPQKTMSAPSFGSMMAPEIGLAGVVCHTGFRAHYVEQQGGEVPSSISADRVSRIPESTSVKNEDHHDMFARGRFRVAPTTIPCLLDKRQGSLVKRGRFAVSVDETGREGALRKTAHGGSRLKEEHNAREGEPRASDVDELAQLYDEAQAGTASIASLATQVSNGGKHVTTDPELLLLRLLEAQRESLAAENAALCQENEWMKQQLSKASVLGF